MNAKTRNDFRLTVLAAALLGVCGQAVAADEDVQEMVKPQSVISAGAGNITKQFGRFGQYNGMNNQGTFALVDLLWITRDDETGRWFKLDGRNLGLENRSLRFEHLLQGNWGYFLDYSQTPRYSQYVVNTRLAGIGTGSQAVAGESVARDVQLKTEREAFSAGFDKRLPAGFDVQVRFKTEEKTGSRLYGRSSGDFLAEPIDSKSRQIEAILGYVGEQLQMQGGYYASRFDNSIPALFAVGDAGATFSPIALPPGNESHQGYLSGTLAFTPLTRATFKFSVGRFTQDAAFIPAPAATPNLTGRTSLDGRVDTKLIQFGLSSRPVSGLSLVANFRYEDRDDKTPIVRYGVAPTAGSTFDGLYEPRSIESRVGKLEASYQLPMGYRLIGAAEFDQKNRYVPPGPLVTVAAREKTEEKSYRAELRRSLSETVNGSVAFIRSDRDGSPLLTSVGFLSGLPTSNLVGPFHVADRKRDKVRVMADWTPVDSLSLQFAAESSDDTYKGRPMGLRDGKARNYSLDATYSLNDVWKLTAWASQNNTSGTQVTQTCTTTVANVCTVVGQIWSAKLDNLGDAAGLSLRGSTKDWAEIGADYSHSKDRGKYAIGAAYPTGITPPPDSNYNVNRLKFFGRYALQKQWSLRTEYVYQRFTTDDWTWTNFTYADGTKVLQKPEQTVHFFGVSVQYRF